MRAFSSLAYMSTQSVDPHPSPAGRRPVRSDAPCFFRPCSLRRCEATRDGSLQAQYLQRTRPYRGSPLRTNWAGVRHAQQAWHTRLTQNCPFRVPGVEYSVYTPHIHAAHRGRLFCVSGGGVRNSPVYMSHAEVVRSAPRGGIQRAQQPPHMCFLQRLPVLRTSRVLARHAHSGPQKTAKRDG